MSAITAFILGGFVGAILGFAVAALCAAASNADQRIAHEQRRNEP